MFCVASEVLTKDRTMTILVKQVIKIRIPGATEKTVKSSSNLTVELTSVGLLELKKINEFIHDDKGLSSFLQNGFVSARSAVLSALLKTTEASFAAFFSILTRIYELGPFHF